MPRRDRSRLVNKENQFSKTTVNRAGEVLIRDPHNENALEVLEYWRGLQAGVLEDGRRPNDFLSVGWIHVNVAARIKRTVSIIEKLKRYPSMKLSRMQDIAGLRFVVDFTQTPTTASGAFQAYVETFQKHTMKSFINKAVDNYVQSPRPSGYRAIHLVYQNDIGQFLEIQFRTRLQHLWAMAVETVGMFYGQALKASQGDQDWLDFFRLASAAISHVESGPVVAIHADTSVEAIRKELKRQGTEQSFFSKLAAIKEVDEKFSAEEYDYWLLELNIKRGENTIYGFTANQLQTAQEMYVAKEQTPACRRGDVQVVLVSTRSFKDLRKAYPSYFLDVADFMNLVEEI
ncbi:MAG: hypothetical protein FWE95_06335 [Planctomycetaceae bacterium]|nr:hypothetical protein [Planctomycetaceae bacterium]